MFYLNFLKDKYNVPYICGTPKGENLCYLLKRAREYVLSIESVWRICGCLVGNRIEEEEIGSPMK